MAFDTKFIASYECTPINGGILDLDEIYLEMFDESFYERAISDDEQLVEDMTLVSKKYPHYLWDVFIYAEDHSEPSVRWEFGFGELRQKYKAELIWHEQDDSPDDLLVIHSEKGTNVYGEIYEEKSPHDEEYRGYWVKIWRTDDLLINMFGLNTDKVKKEHVTMINEYCGNKESAERFFKTILNAYHELFHS